MIAIQTDFLPTNVIKCNYQAHLKAQKVIPSINFLFQTALEIPEICFFFVTDSTIYQEGEKHAMLKITLIGLINGNCNLTILLSQVHVRSQYVWFLMRHLAFNIIRIHSKSVCFRLENHYNVRA